ncbi:MAG: hypothetical protein JRE40_06830 [Deltaproteobacteria bacterium]|nr:hypothetical protein [Deltaproteobacteria bacterium]MBW2672941.1 hypothetical protein [Deltaproteobacteria bacterium]
MATYTIDLKGKTVPPHGVGARVVQGRMTIAPASEAVHSSDVELRTIQALMVQSPAIGTAVFVSVSAPGSYDNYASLTAYNLATAGAPVAAAGSHTLTFVAVGE